jgi:hypothetical protein
MITIDKEENDSSVMDDRIIEGVQTQEINQEINSNLNIILIKLEIELNVSWDRGFFTLPNQDLIWTERKVSYIERLPKCVEELSTKENGHGEIKDIFPIVVTLYREDEVRELRNGIEAMVVGGFTKNNGSISMAERTNLAMIMAATGKEVETIINREGNIIAIGNVVLTFATIMREIGGKTRPEIVLVIITSDESTMKEIRDYQLELKVKSNEGWELVYLFGAAYYYVQSLTIALQNNETPDTYNGINNVAVYNLNNEVTALEVLEYMTRIIGPVFVNAQIEDQRSKSDELMIDKKDSEKRVYLYLGKNKIEINDETLRGLADYMKPNSIRIEDQVLVSNMLPYSTTTYWYYLKGLKKINYSGSGQGGKSTENYGRGNEGKEREINNGRSKKTRDNTGREARRVEENKINAGRENVEGGRGNNNNNVRQTGREKVKSLE